jgi:hypothetical protein
MAFFRPSRLRTPPPSLPSPEERAQLSVDIDLLELHRFVESVARDGLHLHRHSLPGAAGVLYRWVAISNPARAMRKGKSTCGTNRCYKLKLKNVKPA